MIEKNLKKYSRYFKGYTELRLHESRSLEISLANGKLVSCENRSQGGFFSRVYREGAWGCASKSGYDAESAAYVSSKAFDNAVFLGSKQRLNSLCLPSAASQQKKDISSKRSRGRQQEIIDFMREADARLAASCGYLTGRRFILAESEAECSIITSDGAAAYSNVPITRIIAYLSAEKGGTTADVSQFFGGSGNFEEVFEGQDRFLHGLQEVAEHLMRKTSGIYPQAGLRTCLLAPAVTGMLAHEAIGHTAEADNVLNGSVAKDLLGKSVASPLVNLADFANSSPYGACPVPVFTDEEGTAAKDTVLIKDGVLAAYLHSKETAAIFNAVPYGNARAATYADEPVVRMRNTAILPGKDRLSDMISSIDDGYYFLIPNNGLADFSGEFMFGIQIGYEIKRGKIGRPLKNCSVSGYAYDVLKSVSMLSDEFEWRAGTRCGKKQWLPVGLGGAAVKCLANVGGK